MRLLYDLIIMLLALVLIPYGFLKGLPYGLAFRGTLERFVHYRRKVKLQLLGRRVILIHAVSVGEIHAATPLIKKLKLQYPQHLLVLSTTTFTGRRVAEKIAEIDLLVFFPLDFSLIMRRFLRRLHPELVLIVETELWPNFLRLIRRRNIPLLLVNGRISKRSFSRYRRIRFLIRPMLKAFTVFCMQDNICARRIKALGAVDKRVCVTGNVKFDVAVNASGQTVSSDFQKGLKPGQFVWVGGSTRSGENEILLACHRKLLDSGVPSLLVLAPRHPKRFDAVADLLKREGVAFIRRSEWQASSLKNDYSVLLLDTMGELDQVYAFAETVFVGGSLVPLGGHNLLEPARSGKPVLHGPHMSNFMEIAKLLKEAGASQRVNDQDDLFKCLDLLYRDPDLRNKMGQNGRLMVEKNAGATLKTLEQIRPLLRAKNG